MNKPYHERPDWILKAIGYYCDNYTLDGQDLGKLKRGAIKHYKKNMHRGRNINWAMPNWNYTPQGFAFWDSLSFLSGTCYSNSKKPLGPPLCGTMCAPWTNYEKRKIAKLPEVK